MRRGLGGLLAVAIVVSVVFVAVALFTSGGRPDFLRSKTCQVTVDGYTVALTPEQAENAATIASVASKRGLPARAMSIAFATAYQESNLYNLDYGDRDSLGLFQQRPSQGWGTEEQVQDPVYAANAFYDELADLPLYREMEINDAAQAVQRSGFPDAYADHERDARALASALSGNSRAALTCEVDSSADSDTDASDLIDSGLVERADRVRDRIKNRYGSQVFGGFAPGGVRDGHIPGSTHYEGRAVDVFYRPINPSNKVRGWAVAQYLVAHAEPLDVQTVIFDAQIWTARRSGEGWREYRVPDRPGDRAILEHRDHVHVDVFD